MSDSTDSTLDILVKLGVVGQQHVQLARQLLQQMGGATPATGDANTIPGTDAEIAVDVAKERGIKLEGNPQLSAEIDRILPGLGQDLRGLFGGPLGPVILLASAVVAVKQYLKDGNAGLHKVGGQEAAAHQVANAGDETGSNKKRIENIKAITDARLDACKEFFEALDPQKIAHMHGRGATPEQIAQVEERSRRDAKFIDQARRDNRAADGPKAESAVPANELENGETVHQQAGQDRGYAVLNAINPQSGKTGRSFGDLAAAIGLTEPQKLNVDRRVLNHTLPMQHAFAGLERRMAQIEAQLRQTLFSGS
jgi:hypothetical protein